MHDERHAYDFLSSVCSLFGITTLQAYWYYHSYPNDSLLHKCSVSRFNVCLFQFGGLIMLKVALLWTLDAFHLALVVHTVYAYVVGGFNDRYALLHIEWYVSSHLFLRPYCIDNI